MNVWNRGFTLTWLGHSTFRLVTRTGQVIYFDPWLQSNPMCPEAERAVERCDLIVLSHAHGDHSADVVRLATRFECPVVCAHEASIFLASKGVTTCSAQGKSGTQRIGAFAFTMVHATHSSSFQDGGQIVYAGGEAGFVVTLEDGTKLYHAGDTGLTADMQFTGELYAPEIALLPIGDHYTMGPREAAYAARLVRSKWIVPMHYGTFPALTGTPEALRTELAALGVAATVIAPRPGEDVS